MFARVVRALVWLALCLATTVWAEGALVAIPALKARVTDLTATLSDAQRSALDSELQRDEEKGSQIAVLLVPTTQPEAIEQYSIRVVESWKLGKKGVDNGLLILVAKDDHKVRIEVGYGLEGVIPDAIAKRVIAETITPRFKQGDFAGGLSAGSRRLSGLIKSRPLTKPVEPATPGASANDTNSVPDSPGLASSPDSPNTLVDAQKTHQQENATDKPNEDAGASDAEPRAFNSKPATTADSLDNVPIWLWCFILLGGTLLRGRFGGLRGGGVTGVLSGAGAFFSSSAALFSALVGLGAFLFTLIGIQRILLILIEGMLSGSSSGGSRSSSQSGSSFSGGGGSFGGGGASGSW